MGNRGGGGCGGNCSEVSRRTHLHTSDPTEKAENLSRNQYCNLFILRYLVEKKILVSTGVTSEHRICTLKIHRHLGAKINAAKNFAFPSMIHFLIILK